MRAKQPGACASVSRCGVSRAMPCADPRQGSARIIVSCAWQRVPRAKDSGSRAHDRVRSELQPAVCAVMVVPSATTAVAYARVRGLPSEAAVAAALADEVPGPCRVRVAEARLLAAAGARRAALPGHARVEARVVRAVREAREDPRAPAGSCAGRHARVAGRTGAGAHRRRRRGRRRRRAPGRADRAAPLRHGVTGARGVAREVAHAVVLGDRRHAREVARARGAQLDVHRRRTDRRDARRRHERGARDPGGGADAERVLEAARSTTGRDGHRA